MARLVAGVLIVDGYNIISAWDELALLKKTYIGSAREQLVAVLAPFLGSCWQRIIVVFDAYQVKGQLEHWEKIDGVEVVYSREGETADTLIERLATALVVARQRVEVASSDLGELRSVAGRGATAFSALELKRRLDSYRKQIRGQLNKDGLQSSLPLEKLLGEKERSTLECWRRQRGDGGKKA